MRRIFTAICLGLAFCATGSTQQSTPDVPATREDVEKYLQVMHSNEMMKQMAEAMSAPMHKMLHDEFVKNQDKLPADFEAQMGRLMDDMLKNMPWDDMLQAMVPAYEKHFSKNDLEALTAFYSTPTGQKILRELPAITAEAMQDMMPVMQKYIQTVTQRIQQEMEARLRDADKAGAKNPPAKN